MYPNRLDRRSPPHCPVSTIAAPHPSRAVGARRVNDFASTSLTRAVGVCLVIVSVTLEAGCGSDPCEVPPPPGPGATLTERRRQDLDYLDAVLRACHPDMFARVTEAQFMAEKAALEAAIPTMEDDEFDVALTELVALIDDSHTVAILALRPRGVRTFPLRLFWFDEGLFVINSRQAYQNLVGRRLDQINGTAIEDVIDRIEPIISYENDRWFRSQAMDYVLVAELLKVKGVTAEATLANFTFASPTQTSTTVELRARTGRIGAPNPSGGPLAYQNNNLTYWFTYDETEDLFYVQYNRAQNDPEESFRAFNDRLWSMADSVPIRRFVVDLRHNVGGNSSVIQPLMDSIRARSAINREGVLYGIIGRDTFSSGMLNAIQLRWDTNATLVGEATGGTPNGFGEVRIFELPNSGIFVGYSTKVFRLLPGPDEPQTVLPDIEVRYTAEDYFNQRDPAMEVVLTDSGS